MTALAGFLASCVDDDEAAAKAATPGPWLALDGGVQCAIDECVWPVSQTESARDREDRVHIARNDPARALREAEFKRKVIARHVHVDASYEVAGHPPFGCRECARNDDGSIAPLGWCDEMRDLADVYRDQPGYAEAIG